jgi:ferredoxin
MPTVVFVGPLGQPQTAQAPEGGPLIALCDAADAPVPFHCRRGNCGTCRIAVLEGADQLLPAQRDECGVLELLGLSPPSHRLACQARMRAGLEVLRVSPLGKRARLPSALWIPVVVDAVTNQMRACPGDPNAGDIVISGAAELTAGSVVVMTFRSRAASAMDSVVGRVLRVAPPGNDPRRHVVAIELLEPDSTLASLFEPAPAMRAD